MIQLIGKTTMEKGLIVRAMKDETIYQKGIKVTNEKIDALIS
jgi:hypothetical protein